MEEPRPLTTLKYEEVLGLAEEWLRHASSVIRGDTIYMGKVRREELREWLRERGYGLECALDLHLFYHALGEVAPKLGWRVVRDWRNSRHRARVILRRVVG